MYEARYILGDCISLYNPTCARRVHTCRLPRDIQQICCSITGRMLSCLGTATLYNIHTSLCCHETTSHIILVVHGGFQGADYSFLYFCVSNTCSCKQCSCTHTIVSVVQHNVRIMNPRTCVFNALHTSLFGLGSSFLATPFRLASSFI